MFVLHLLLFIVCLSVLVVVHELGHLAAAKAFKVYCFEFSVGFGPAIFRRKRKRGETYVAFRIVPFGGFVSMYGENDANSDQLPDGIESIPANRSLANIKAWKKLIIMAAGVTLNAVLALVLLFSSNMFFVQQEMYVRNISVKEDSIAYNAGIRNGDVLLPYGFNDMNNIPEDAYNAYTGDSKNNQNFYILDKDGLLYFEDTTLAPKQVAVLLNVNPYVLTLKNSSYDNKISLYELDDQGLVNFTTLITLSEGNYSYIEFDLQTCKYFDEGIAYNIKDHKIVSNIVTENNKTSISPMGLGAFVYSYRNNFGEATSKSFKEFGQYSGLIFETLGNLFIGKNWNQVGGPVAIFTESSAMLENYGPTYFIRLWAIISVNLAIFNLIPFPGLDGWHILVTAIEGITRKKIPEKAKTIVSYVGMALLFALMIVIVVKDVIGLF